MVFWIDGIEDGWQVMGDDDGDETLKVNWCRLLRFGLR